MLGMAEIWTLAAVPGCWLGPMLMDFPLSTCCYVLTSNDILPSSRQVPLPTMFYITFRLLHFCTNWLLLELFVSLRWPSHQSLHLSLLGTTSFRKLALPKPMLAFSIHSGIGAGLSTAFSLSCPRYISILL